ncbi:MAG: translation elongation factor Ts [Planctomycetaceae bacterium]|nr:translation elongation factor Ts [Planctomycetaceae bacterium]
MAEITAALVRQLREETGLPMMDCKQALTATGGDLAAAKDELRKKGLKIQEGRGGRETSFGRFGIYAGLANKSGAIVELKCESAPVAGSAEFIQLANDLAKQLATGKGAKTADELLDQPSPSQPDKTLRQVKDDMFNRIREVFNVGRMARIEGTCGGYSHNSGTVSGVLVQVEGGSDEAAKDVSMHIAAMRPLAVNKEEVDPKVVDKERAILREQALAEGKPANIVDKMVEGRLKNFYAERVLLEQPFVKENSISVGKYAESKGMKVKKFVHWELGKE